MCTHKSLVPFCRNGIGSLCDSTARPRIVDVACLAQLDSMGFRMETDGTNTLKRT